MKEKKNAQFRSIEIFTGTQEEFEKKRGESYEWEGLLCYNKNSDNPFGGYTGFRQHDLYKKGIVALVCAIEIDKHVVTKLEGEYYAGFAVYKKGDGDE